MCVFVCLSASPVVFFSTGVLMGFDCSVRYIYINILCSRPIFGSLGLTVKQNWVEEVTDSKKNNLYEKTSLKK